MNNKEKNLLLSIKPKYALDILNGLKTIELRRKFPLFKRSDNKIIFIYASYPISKIIGRCRLKQVKELPINDLWNISKKKALVDKDFFNQYFQDCVYGFALYIYDSVKYKTPINLKKCSINIHPPQSYRYIMPGDLPL